MKDFEGKMVLSNGSTHTNDKNHIAVSERNLLHMTNPWVLSCLSSFNITKSL